MKKSINFWVHAPVKINEIREDGLIVKFPREITFQGGVPYEIKILDNSVEIWENDFIKERFKHE